jgi:DNA-binding NtrC family response regulator
VPVTKYRLLFVDDEESVRRSLGNYFRELGYEVHLAASGKEGLALYEQAQPHVVVLDLRMPGMSGLEVLESLRQRDAVVLMLTGYGEIETAVQAMRLGAENFLQKPVDMPHLVAAVEKAGEKAELRRENRELRARLSPNFRRRLAQIAIAVALVGGALAVGWLIGGERGERPTRPIPVPIQPADTTMTREAPPGALDTTR